MTLEHIIVGFGLKDDPKKLTILTHPAKRECDGCKEIFYAYAGEQYFCSDKCKHSPPVLEMTEDCKKHTMSFGVVLHRPGMGKVELYGQHSPLLGRGIKYHVLVPVKVGEKEENGVKVDLIQLQRKDKYHQRFVSKPGSSLKAKKSLVRKAKKGGGKKRGMKAGRQRRARKN